jgi:hypothetical protein
MYTEVVEYVDKIENWISGCDRWKNFVTVVLGQDNSMKVIAIGSSNSA